jgi:hypothetical protein
MKYYDPEERTLVVTQVWKVHVTARRYFNKAMAEIKEKLQPEHECIWKSSVGKYDGYQADLVSFSIDPALDSAPLCPYPDW